jgi:toxin ParE1/3/4
VSVPVRFKLAAEHDVVTAADWYDRQRSGLGAEFLTTLAEAVSRISMSPESTPLVRSRIRRLALRTFPYLLFYVFEAEEVVVLACMHASRDPNTWPS